MADRDIIAAVQSLKGDLASIVTAIGGMSSLSSPSGGGILTGKNINELMMDNTKQLEEVTKSLTKTRESQENNIKAMQLVTASLATFGPALQQYAKYGIAMPFQMLSGISGQIGQGMLSRERDMAQSITSTIGGIVGLINPAAGALIGGVGALAAPILGQVFRQDTSRAATRKEAVEWMASGRLGFDDSFMYNYQVQRGNFGARGMRGNTMGSSSGISEVLGQMGMSSQESAAAAFAIMSQGARGYSKFDINNAKSMTDKGIYGFDVVANAVALQIGNRTGFSQAELEGASRRTGFHVPEMAQAAQMVRGQTFFMGMGAGNQVFNAATNTTMSQIIGAPAAAQALMQAGQATASAASGNEATEMILFQQYQDANPGDSYMDFLEAKSMGSNSDKWRKMMAGAAKSFSAMGQMGGLLGVGTRVFQGASKAAMGASTKFFRQAAGEIGVEDLTKEEGQAALDMNAQRRQSQIRAEAAGISRRIAGEEGLQASLDRTHEGFMAVAKNADSLTTATLQSAEVTKKELIPQMQALEHALYRAGDWLTGGARTRWDAEREASTGKAIGK